MKTKNKLFLAVITGAIWGWLAHYFAFTPQISNSFLAGTIFSDLVFFPENGRQFLQSLYSQVKDFLFPPETLSDCLAILRYYQHPFEPFTLHYYCYQPDNVLTAMLAGVLTLVGIVLLIYIIRLIRANAKKKVF